MRRLMSIVAGVGLIVLAASAAPASAAGTAAAADCWAAASTPRYVEGSIVYAGEIRCRTVVPEIEVEVDLTTWSGTRYRLEADTSKSCDTAQVCRDVGYHPNRAGNQIWCTEVWGDHVSKSRVCENENW